MAETLPDQMTAIAITTPGGPEVLKPVRLALPRPGAQEILLRVHAAGVNRPDVVQRQGHYPPPPGTPDTPGLEIAGDVVAVGPGVARWRIGDAVTALVPGGGYAEYCVAAESCALPIPHGLDFVQAAAIPETFFTVWDNVFTRGELKRGERFLVHGGTSGIGTTAIQLARAFGATVFTTAGSDDKCEVTLRLGAHRAINYRREDFVAAIKSETDNRGVDVVLDMVGGDYLPRNIECLALHGRHVSIAFLHGAKVTLTFMPVMLKRLVLTGSTLRPRSVTEKAAIAIELETRVWPLLSAGTVRPVIDSTFPLVDAAAAHSRMETSAHIGKIVLTVS